MTGDRGTCWARSRYCVGANSTCVEIAMGVDQVGVRDGKENAGLVLLFSTEEWHAFIGGIRAGDFNG
ncbi:MAG: DUF397 domain-containing protein [Pseudonocardiaceae bacterium]